MMILKHLKYQLLSNMWYRRVRRKFILPASKVVPSGGVFCEKNKMQNSIDIQSRRNQTITGDDSF